MCEFCNAWVCVCVCFVICEWVCDLFVMCGCVYVLFFVMCGCVYVLFL